MVHIQKRTKNLILILIISIHTFSKINTLKHNIIAKRNKLCISLLSHYYQISKDRRITKLHVTKNKDHDHEHDQSENNYSPFPKLPSYNVITLASSQLELLTHSLLFESSSSSSSKQQGSSSENMSKIKSCILYLPHENSKTGQLEFVPTVIYPNPLQERIFIANDAESGVPPEIPKNTLNRLLVGFVHAKSVLPTYPFVSSGSTNGGSRSANGDGAGLGDIEEGEDGVISCALFSGTRTVGVLVIWPNHQLPNIHNNKQFVWTNNSNNNKQFWTIEDKLQISRVSYSLSLALIMDYEIYQTQIRTEELRQSLSNNLHQVKNPIQALRTFGKLLQRKIALEEQMQFENGTSSSVTSRNSNDGAVILSLAENIIAQSDRVVDLLLPMDGIVMALEQSHPETYNDIYLRLLKPSDDTASTTTTGKYGTRNTYLESINDNKYEYNGDASQEDGTANNSFMTKYKDAAQKKDKDKSNNDNDKSRLVLTFIPDIIQPILPAFKAISSERNIKFIYNIIDEDNIPGIKIIPSLLQEALSNIIDNAIKYVIFKKRCAITDDSSFITNPNPTIKVTVRPNSSSEKKSGVTIYVQDNGIGISTSDQNNIFKRDYRSNDVILLNINGSGLGLDISYDMIKQMNGVLDIIPLDYNDDDNDVEYVTTIRIMLFR